MKLQSVPTYNRYQRKVSSSEISKSAAYLHITYLYRLAPQFSEMTSRVEKICVIECTKTNLCTSVHWPLRKRFHTDPPSQVSIQRWFDTFGNQGCICKKKRTCLSHVC
jgi:hypothetical protein